jgi:hypothetical protein
MGTARDFDDILKRELNIHAAWLPVTNTFRLGDYGIVSDGVLVPMGNIKRARHPSVLCRGPNGPTAERTSSTTGQV